MSNMQSEIFTFKACLRDHRSLLSRSKATLSAKQNSGLQQYKAEEALFLKHADELQEKQANLESHLTRLEGQLAEHNKAKQESEDQQQKYMAELRELCLRKDEALLESERLRKKLDTLTAAVVEVSKDVQKELKFTQERAERISKAANYFQERLSLRMTSSSSLNNTIVLIFTNIDPSKPDREFTLQLRVNEDKAYSVPHCHPEIPEIEEMVAKLNSSQDLTGFMCAVHKRFTSLA